MKVYEVQTYGGQIIDAKEPKEVNVTGEVAKRMKADFKRFGFSRDAWGNYFETMEKARAAVRFALAN